MHDITDKYSNSVLENLNEENSLKIIDFLNENDCDYMEDILEDYLDLFTIEFEIFKNNFNKLNIKYNNEFLEKAKENMNLLEELYI